MNISPLAVPNGPVICLYSSSEKQNFWGEKAVGFEHLCYAAFAPFCYSFDLAYICAILAVCFAAILDRFWPLMDNLWRAAMHSIFDSILASCDCSFLL